MSRMVCTLVLARQKFPGAKHSLDALCTRFGVDRSQRIKHGALLDAQLLAQVYVELTGGRQIGLTLVAELVGGELPAGDRAAAAPAPIAARSSARPARMRRARRSLPATPPSWRRSRTRSGTGSRSRLDPVDLRRAARPHARREALETMMDIRVSGHQIDTGEALQTTGGSTAPRHRRQIFLPRDFRPGHLRPGPLRSQLHLRHRRPCPPGRGAQGLGRARRWRPTAFELAADRIEKQLRRYKRRLKDRHAQTAHRRSGAGGRLYRVRAAARGGGAGRHPPVDRRNQGGHSLGFGVRRGDAARSAQHQRPDVPQQRHRRLQHGLPARRRHDRLGRARARDGP